MSWGQTIIDFFEYINSLIEYVFSLISSLCGYVVSFVFNLLGAITVLPDVLSFFPEELSVILLSVFACVVLYKVLGRE